MASGAVEGVSDMWFHSIFFCLFELVFLTDKPLLLVRQTTVIAICPDVYAPNVTMQWPASVGK